MSVGGRVAGKYELVRLLGEGAMGAVYEGIHVEIGKRLAIKLIRKEFSENLEIAARFRREARAASAVESEYIAQIFDFGRDDDRGLYMVIEYLEGEDLETRLGRERWIEEREAATIGIQVARGLARAHAAGIVHRDLKPANIFLTRRDDGALLAKILDFGVSKYESPVPGTTVEPTLTELGTTLGTPQYMSPEQCVGKLELDGRTDVWSLCAVLYEMIAGEPAIPGGGGHIAAMQRIVRQGVAPLASRAAWAPERLARIIDSGLVRDRNERIPDASTLAARLLEEYPDAVSHPSVSSGLARQTDVSELQATRAAWVSTLVDAPPSGPPADEAPLDETGERNAETLPRTSDVEQDEDNIATLRPAPLLAEATRDSSEPPDGEDVEVFSRNSGGLPKELLALRSKRKI